MIMRTLAGVTIVAILMTLQSPSLGDGLGQGIAAPGSPHNFADNIGGAELPSAGGWNDREEICRVCHVPHDRNLALVIGDSGLLWNHALSNTTYTMYTSPSMDAATPSQPTGFTKLCLGCHDGTVGIDTFDNQPGGSVFIEDYDVDAQVPGALNAGDLSKSHPVSIVYDSSVIPELRPKSDPMGTSGSIEDVLENGTTLQCSSCHDVHDAPGESIPGTHLLRVSQAASDGTPSGLCLTCHIK